jgi:hypothetical protein
MQQEFARRLAEQRSTVYAEGTTFSGSAVFVALKEIEQLARQIDENSRERAEVLALMSEVQRRRHEWEEAILLAQQSLAIQQRSGALSEPQLFDLHYAIADGSAACGSHALCRNSASSSIRFFNSPSSPSSEAASMKRDIGWPRDSTSLARAATASTSRRAEESNAELDHLIKGGDALKGLQG